MTNGLPEQKRESAKRIEETSDNNSTFNPAPSTFEQRSSPHVQVVSFPALTAQRGIRHFFTTRCPITNVQTDKETALQRLEEHHAQLLAKKGFAVPLITAQQIHSNKVATVNATSSPIPVPDVDSLITNDPTICLGIFVADCAAVYLFDPVNRAIGLVHSGKKGTELGIVPRTIQQMQEAFNTNPADLILQISPCIRPPHYEIDFAASIAQSAYQLGVKNIHDCGICTAENWDRYYSYRREKGQTGRMLAALCLLANC